jgi:hypothetical protein
MAPYPPVTYDSSADSADSPPRRSMASTRSTRARCAYRSVVVSAPRPATACTAGAGAPVIVGRHRTTSGEHPFGGSAHMTGVAAGKRPIGPLETIRAADGAAPEPLFDAAMAAIGNSQLVLLNSYDHPARCADMSRCSASAGEGGLDPAGLVKNVLPLAANQPSRGTSPRSSSRSGRNWWCSKRSSWASCQPRRRGRGSGY